MIIDSFLFGLEYECDILEIRLNYLNDIVDYFVLAECGFTHTGEQKELFFEKNKERFKKFLPKIIHVKEEKKPEIPSKLEKKRWGYTVDWKYENYQRNLIKLGWDQLSLSSTDIMMLSDLDEIPFKETVKYYHDNKNLTPIRLLQTLFLYRLNLKTTNRKWKGTLICTKDFAYENGPQGLRSNMKVPFCNKLNGGWHLSYMGNASQVFQKINSVVEHDFHNNWKDENILAEAIKNNTVHSSGEILTKIDLDTEKPFIDKEIILRYPHLLA